MAFGNDILAGNKLVREAMESQDFITGVSGWQVTKDGDAEFNELLARGEISTVGPVYTTEIEDGRILIFTNDVPDLSNMELLAGLLTMQDAAGNQCAIEMNGNNMSITVNNGNGIVIDPNGYIFRKDSPVFAWQNVTINSGSALGTAGPQCKLLPTGQVIFRGGITGYAIGATLIGTVPAGLRPTTAEERFEVAPNTSGGSNALKVESSGAITMTRNAVQSSWLSGISYSVI